jgi:hypothetical protein
MLKAYTPSQAGKVKFHVKQEVMKGLIKGAIALLNQVLEQLEGGQPATPPAVLPMSGPPQNPVDR